MDLAQSIIITIMQTRGPWTGTVVIFTPRKTQGQSDFEEHRIYHQPVLRRPPSRDNGGQTSSPFCPFSSWKGHTHTHMPGSRCHFKQSPKDICWTPTYPLHLATCSAGHLLVAFFVFSVPFASLVSFCGYPDRTVLASRARGCCDEDDDDIDEMRSQR